VLIRLPYDAKMQQNLRFRGLLLVLRAKIGKLKAVQIFSPLQLSDNGLSGFTRQSCIFSQVVNLTTVLWRGAFSTLAYECVTPLWLRCQGISVEQFLLFMLSTQSTECFVFQTLLRM
jgi:hypothetical protein